MVVYLDESWRGLDGSLLAAAFSVDSTPELRAGVARRETGAVDEELAWDVLETIETFDVLCELSPRSDRRDLPLLRRKNDMLRLMWGASFLASSNLAKIRKRRNIKYLRLTAVCQMRTILQQGQVWHRLPEPIQSQVIAHEIADATLFWGDPCLGCFPEDFW